MISLFFLVVILVVVAVAMWHLLETSEKDYRIGAAGESAYRSILNAGGTNDEAYKASCFHENVQREACYPTGLSQVPSVYRDIAFSKGWTYEQLKKWVKEQDGTDLEKFVRNGTFDANDL